jgi:hypothetical protein
MRPIPVSSALRTSVLGLLSAILPLASVGCASSGSSPEVAGAQPQVSVERFLEAANTRDLDAMARIFGTEAGPIADQTGSGLGCAFRRVGSWLRISNRCTSWQDIEVRMNTIAYILRHDRYQLRSESTVAGREARTIRVGVDLEWGRESHADVPFVVVQSRGGRWLVQEIGLERITSSP